MFPYAVRKEYTIQYNTFLLILPEGLFRINLQYVYIIQLRLHSFFNKNVVFPAQAEHSYSSADFRLKIFLYYS